MDPHDTDALDHTVRLTHEWVGELRERLGWRSRRDALHLMRAVLTETRDRLPPAGVADLAAQMPLLIRGMYYEGWHPARAPLEDGAGAFERAVGARMRGVEAYRGRADVGAVFDTLANRIGARETRRALPEGARALWTGGAARRG